MKIAMTGKMRSGKDTAATILQERLELSSLAFATGIEEVILRYFPNAFANGKPRKYYQFIGQHFRELDPQIWVKQLDKSMRNQEAMLGIEDFIVTDMRQPNEYEFLKERGFTIVKVEADYNIRLERAIQSGDEFDPEDMEHETEQFVDSIPHDYLLTNNTSLEDFIKQINHLEQLLREDEL